MKDLIRFDWAIKRLLRNKANFGILEGFLSELLGEDVTIEQLLDGESNKETASNKLNRVDILVKNANGELVIVEVQNYYQADYLLRMLFGTAKLIVDHMDEGMPYEKVKKIISIHIVYFDLGVGNDYLYYGTTSFVGKYTGTPLHLSTQEKEIFQADIVEKVYPQYYIIKVKDFDKYAVTGLDEWIQFLKTQEIRENTGAKGLKEAKAKLKYLQLTEEEKRDYQRYVENWRDEEGIIVGNYKKGRLDGRLEKALEMARNCLAEGLNITQIMKLTGLTEDEIGAIE